MGRIGQGPNSAPWCRIVQGQIVCMPNSPDTHYLSLGYMSPDIFPWAFALPKRKCTIFAPPWKWVGGHLPLPEKRVGGHLPLYKTIGVYHDFLSPEPKRYKKRLTNHTLLSLNPKTQILARLEFGLWPNTQVHKLTQTRTWFNSDSFISFPMMKV